MNSAKLRKIILEELSTSRSARPYRRPRKLGLADYLGESSDRYLLELEDDLIISTGMRIHEELGTFGDSDGSGDGDDPEVVNSIESPPASATTPTAATTATPDSSTDSVTPAEPPAPPAPSTTPVTVPTPEPDTTDSAPETVADVDDTEELPGAESIDSDSVGDDNYDSNEFASDPDVATSSDGLGDSIINRLIAGAGEEDAQRNSPAGTGPASQPSADVTDTSGPEATANITDKKALSRYLDQVALGKVKVSLDESRKFKQKFRG